MNSHIQDTASKETEYARLRRELETAYAQPVWNTRLIDRLANALAKLEWASVRRAVCTNALDMAET